MNRRGFLGRILAAAAAPAIVRADALMRVVPLDTLVATEPGLFLGDVGRFNGILIAEGAGGKIVTPNLATIRAWSAALAAEITKESFFSRRLAATDGGPILVSPSWQHDLIHGHPGSDDD